MAITINGDGTLTGISVGGLPDGIVDTDMLATDAVSAAKLQSNAIASGDLPAGSILQVLQDVKTDTDSTTNNIENAETIAGLSQAITMTASTNKVLVMAQVSISGSANSESGLSLYRGTTQIYRGDSGTGDRASVPAGMAWTEGAWQGHPVCITFLDTPGTGTHTYTVKFGGNGSDTIYVNRTGRNGASDPLTASSITLMEVAA